MGETYCGKSCDSCTWKETLNCPGCQYGPGRMLSKECKIASCCREKGHYTCDSCNLKVDCLSLRSRYQQPEYRKKDRDAELERKQENDARAALIGEWIWFLFWLVVPSFIAAITSNEKMFVNMPRLNMFGTILGIIVSIVYGVILLKLSPAEERYKTAGICHLIVVAGNLINLFIWRNSASSIGPLLTTLPFTAVSYYAIYSEFTAHSSVLNGIDYELSEKWKTLWKWYIGSSLCEIGSALIMLLAPALGAIVYIGSGIAIIVVAVLNMIYLYRTGVIFRDYRPENND